MKAILEAPDLDLKKGDIVLGGKFKNKTYIVDRIESDEKGQPIIVTDKGKKIKLLAIRIKKLMPSLENIKEAVLEPKSHQNFEIVEKKLYQFFSSLLSQYNLEKAIRANSINIVSQDGNTILRIQNDKLNLKILVILLYANSSVVKKGAFAYKPDKSSTPSILLYVKREVLFEMWKEKDIAKRQKLIKQLARSMYDTFYHEYVHNLQYEKMNIRNLDDKTLQNNNRHTTWKYFVDPWEIMARAVEAKLQLLKKSKPEKILNLLRTKKAVDFEYDDLSAMAQKDINWLTLAAFSDAFSHYYFLWREFIEIPGKRDKANKVFRKFLKTLYTSIEKNGRISSNEKNPK